MVMLLVWICVKQKKATTNNKLNEIKKDYGLT